MLVLVVNHYYKWEKIRVLIQQLLQISNWKADYLKQLFCLIWRNDSIRWRRLPLVPLFFSLYRRPSFQTLSNAFDKSKKTPQTSNDGFTSNALKTLWVIQINWLTQALFGLKPGWVLQGCFYHKFKNSI